MRIPTEVTIDGITYDTRWMGTGQSSFVERLEILVSKVIYITLEKCTEDVSNKYKDEIRHLLAKNLALFLTNYADVLFNKGQEFIPDKLFINGQMFDTRYTNHFGSREGKMGPFAILVAVIRTILDGQFENVSFASKSAIGRSITLALCDFFEKNKESLFDNSPTLPERVLDTESLTEALRRFSSVAYHCNDSVQRDKNKDSVSIEGATMSEIAQLISDMTAAGASREELSRAMNHSMAVINAEKAILDRDNSFFNNDIVDLFKKYHR